VFTLLELAYPGCPEKEAVKRVQQQQQQQQQLCTDNSLTIFGRKVQCI